MHGSRSFLSLARSSARVPGTLLIVAMLAVVALPTRSAVAAPRSTIVVDTTADELDGASGNGFCSLREAISNANLNNGAQADCLAGLGADSISLPAGTYTLTGAANDDANLSGDLDIWDSVRIVGAGAKVTIIQAGTNTTDGVDRVLEIQSSSPTVRIDAVTLRYGHAPDGIDGAPDITCSGSPGGGILIQSGLLVLDESVVIDNSSGDGGDGCTAGSTFYGVGGAGGGICALGQLELVESQVVSNSSGDGGDGGPGAAGRSGGNGGGVVVGAGSALTMTHSAVSLNSTGNGGRGGDNAAGAGGKGGSGGDGGGVYYGHSTVALDDSVVALNLTGHGGDGGNSSSGNGGNGGNGGDGAGFYASGGSLTAVGVTISDNQTGPGGTGGSGSASAGSNGWHGSGGGFTARTGAKAALTAVSLMDNSGLCGAGYLSGEATYVSLENSTVSGNLSYQFAGGFYGSDNAVLMLSNSTLSGNRAYDHGGALYISPPASVLLNHVTISANTADLDNNGVGYAGGIASFNSIAMTNTIVAGNFDKGLENPDCFGTVASGDYNLLGIGDSAGCTFVAQPHDLVGTTATPLDPVLSVLGDYGGPTLVHALKPASPAVDQIPAGVNGCAAGARDQRGVVRIPPCDIGAYEIGPREAFLPLALRG